jgi:hypothetical protein
MGRSKELVYASAPGMRPHRWRNKGKKSLLGQSFLFDSSLSRFATSVSLPPRQIELPLKPAKPTRKQRHKSTSR